MCCYLLSKKAVKNENTEAKKKRFLYMKRPFFYP